MNMLKTISNRRATRYTATTRTITATMRSSSRSWIRTTRITGTPKLTPTTMWIYDKRKLSLRRNHNMMVTLLPTLLLATVVFGTDLAGSNTNVLPRLTNIPPLPPSTPLAVDLNTIELSRTMTMTTTTTTTMGMGIPTATPVKTAPTILTAIEETTAPTTINLPTTARGAEAGVTATSFPWTDLSPSTTLESDDALNEIATTIVHASSSPSMRSSDEADDGQGNGDEAVLSKPSPDSLTKGFSIPTFLPPFPAFAVADLPAYAAGTTTTTTTSTTTLVPILAQDIFEQQDQLYMAVFSHQQLRRNLTMPAINVTVQMGNHAYLPCMIRRFMNKPVSWVRARDGHILSVDQTTFIADQRFQSIFKGEHEYTWSLQIKYIQHADEGWYECQVSTEPKMSAKVYLSVVVPITELIGDQNRFVKAGSKVALHCIVRGTLDPPTYIIWFRDKTQITDDNKMGWYTQIDRTIFGNASDNQNTIGSLIMPFVRKKDSGNYTCQPSNSPSVSVDLHVLSGEYSASAIMSGASAFRLNANYLFLILLFMALQET